MVKLMLSNASLVKHFEEKLQEASRTIDTLAQSLESVTRSCEERDKIIVQLEQRIQSMERIHQKFENTQQPLDSRRSETLEIVPHVSKGVGAVSTSHSPSCGLRKSKTRQGRQLCSLLAFLPLPLTSPAV